MPLVSARPSYKAPHMAAQMKNHKFDILPAPVLGLDASTPFTEQDPKTANLLDNFIVRRHGSELRAGYLRWTTNLGGIGTEAKVVTMMAYQPPRGATSTQAAKLFAACDDGKLYDVTAQTNEATVPTSVLTIAGQNEPGDFSYVNFATANTNYLCIVSAGGGYYTYDDAGGWVNRTSSITGAAGSGVNFDFITAWKNRLWFIKENSTEAFYTNTVGAISGVTSLFDFGPLLVHGGELRAMASWTIDSGAGIDDKLVIASSQGDILIYGGTDPTSADTFGLVGRWFIGPPPIGRRFMGKYGGDLAVLCERGVEYMSHMLQAHGLLDPTTQALDTYASRFNEVIGADIRLTRGEFGWSLLHVPGQAIVVLVTPHNVSDDDGQYCFSTIPAAWSTFSNMPIYSAEVFSGTMYFGTADGKVGKAFSADTDDELSDGTVGVDVVGDLQTAFLAPNNDKMSLKRPLLAMPMFQSSSAPSTKAVVNTEWSSVNPSGTPTFISGGVSVWNSALWNSAIWSGIANSYFAWIGATGLGCYMALHLSVVGAPGTIFTSWKIVYEPGGIM